MDSVTKEFMQWQRENTFKGLLRGLVRPAKRAVRALDDVTFEVGRGEFVAYAGPNGSGKSTTMKLLSGMLAPTSGSLSVLGISPIKGRIGLMRRLGVLFGNRTELWWDHPVSQSFEWKRVIWDIPADEYRKALDRVVGLLDISGLLKTFARELSLGQRMRADLAMMLLHSPEVILLDEPTIGLDVVAKRRMIDFLKGLNRESGTTIMVTSHDMDDLEEMAERVLMVSGGRIVYDGDFGGLRDRAGIPSRVRVVTDGRSPISIAGAEPVGSSGGVYEFDVDMAVTPIRDLLKQLSEAPGVRDVEIGKAPIERAIARLYAAWEGSRGPGGDIGS
ncbi:MAG: ATP-binding cassette domain-containing protein [Oscillospiraceae bacterium]|nr:ATP-binding cassette domain-containing protein [Oscillospiraceae bacterium]